MANKQHIKELGLTQTGKLDFKAVDRRIGEVTLPWQSGAVAADYSTVTTKLLICSGTGIVILSWGIKHTSEQASENLPLMSETCQI